MKGSHWLTRLPSMVSLVPTPSKDMIGYYKIVLAFAFSGPMSMVGQSEVFVVKKKPPEFATSPSASVARVVYLGFKWFLVTSPCCSPPNS